MLVWVVGRHLGDATGLLLSTSKTAHVATQEMLQSEIGVPNSAPTL